MHSSLFVMGLVALMLNAALALPVSLDDVQETAETDEQLLKLLAGHSMEAEAVSTEHSRFVRRTPILVPEPTSPPSSGWTAHPDELAHEHFGHKYAGRERRAAGEDSSGSSEEDGQAQQPKEEPKEEPKAEEKADSSSEEKPKTRRRRGAGEDSSASSEEDGQGQKPKEEQKEGKKADSSSEESQEKAKQEQQEQQEQQQRKRRAVGEDSNGKSSEEASLQLEPGTDSSSLMEELSELNNQLNVEDYAQGCEVMEVNSNEANNDTTYVE